VKSLPAGEPEPWPPYLASASGVSMGEKSRIGQVIPLICTLGSPTGVMGFGSYSRLHHLTMAFAVTASSCE